MRTGRTDFIPIYSANSLMAERRSSKTSRGSVRRMERRGVKVAGKGLGNSFSSTYAATGSVDKASRVNQKSIREGIPAES